MITERPPGLQGYRYPYFTTYAIAQLRASLRRRAPSRKAACRSTRRSITRMQNIAQDAVDVGRAAGGRRRHRRARSRARRASSVDGRDPRDGRRRGTSRSPTSSIAPGRRDVSRARRSRSTTIRRRSIPACRRSTIIDDTPVSYPMGDGTQLVAAGRRSQLYGRDLASRRARAIAQRRRGEAGRTRRHRPRHRVRAPHGRHGAARSEPLARARLVGRLAARSGQRLCDARQSGAPHRSHAVPDRERFARQSSSSTTATRSDRRRQRRNGVSS